MPVQFGESTEVPPPAEVLSPAPPPSLEKIDEQKAEERTIPPHMAHAGASASWSRVLCLGYDDVDGDDDNDDHPANGRVGRKKRNSSLLKLMFGSKDDELTDEEKRFKKFGKIDGKKNRSNFALLDTQNLKDYVAFVPRKVLPQLPSMELAEARCSTLQGVVSFLDVAGFTKLTERLAMQPDGAERLAKIINKLMGQLLDTLTTGDVIKFSGDAILVLYEPDHSFMSEADAAEAKKTLKKKKAAAKKAGGGGGSGEFEDELGMRNAAYRAVSEGLRALHDDYTVSAEDLGDYFPPEGEAGADGGSGGDIKLALHVAICAGDLQLMHVGGVFGRWEVVMAGEAMAALGPTADRAPTDHLAVEKKCWSLLEGARGGLVFEGTPIVEPPGDGFVRVLREKRVSYNSSAGSSSSSGGGGGSGDPLMGFDAGFDKSFDALMNPLSSMVESVMDLVVDKEHHRLALNAVEGMDPKHLACLRRYVSPVVQRAISAQTLSAVSCFTDVSCMFVGISGVDLGAVAAEADMLFGQIIMSTVQDCVYDQEGAVNKFVMDDKGALLLCAWGLPPMAHVDDPHRATSAALQLSQELEALGIQAHIGVTTGKVFAGVIGPPHRCEFSMLGDTVNLSARLMGKAPFGGVLCDKPTYDSAMATGVEFEVLEPIKVKGKEGLIPIAKPLKDTREDDGGGDDLRGSVGAGGGLRPKSSAGRKSMWKSGRRDSFDSGARVLSQGHMRTAERETLFETLDSLYLSGGGMLVLSGDAGSGKSELAKSVLSSTENYNSRLIQSLTPKNQGRLSEVAARPCVELSQILHGLLTPEVSSAPTASMALFGVGGPGLGASGGKVKKEPPPPPPASVEEWRERLTEYALAGPGQENAHLSKWLHVFDDYFADWVAESSAQGLDSFEVAADSAAAAAAALDGQRRESVDMEFDNSGGGSSAAEAARESVAAEEESKRTAAMQKLKNRASSSSLGGPSAGSPTSPRSGSPRAPRPRSASATGLGSDANGDGEAVVPKEAKARLVLLSKVLDRVLAVKEEEGAAGSSANSGGGGGGLGGGLGGFPGRRNNRQATRNLMLFVHVRTGSSLSASAVHPEMWGVLRHLGDYAVARFRRGDSAASVAQPDPSSPLSQLSASSSAVASAVGVGPSFGAEAFEWLVSVGDAAPAPGGNALVVALTHRRVLDYGGRAMNQAYASVIQNAETCGGLVQLDPLDHKDREAYLCLSMRVSGVPPEVAKWVSDVANGNPQYIEICASLVDVPDIVQRQDHAPPPGSELKLGAMDNTAGLPLAVLSETGVQSLSKLDKPMKVIGFIKQTLGSLGPEDKIIVQVLSLFRMESPSSSSSSPEEDIPLPTTLVLLRAYQAIADISEHKLKEVLDRLVLYGLVAMYEVHSPPSTHVNVEGRRFVTLEDEDSPSATAKNHFYYSLDYVLLQDMAEEQLLAAQKAKVLAVLNARPSTRSSSASISSSSGSVLEH